MKATGAVGRLKPTRLGQPRNKKRVEDEMGLTFTHFEVTFISKQE